MASDPGEHRLHELSWLFQTAKAAKGLVLPWIFVLFAAGGANYELWAILFIFPAGFAAALKYLVYRYRLTDEELIIRDGILVKTERHIPYARIQNIDLVRNPVHRLLNVALVRVETASGGAPEAVIRVLSLDAVEEMRARVFAERTDAPTTVATVAEGTVEDAAAAEIGARRTLLHLPASELARLGVVSNKGLVVVGAAVGIFWQTDWWARSSENWEAYSGTAREWLATLAAGSPVLAGTALVWVILPVAWLLLRVFSIGWFYVQLHDFTLTRAGRDLRAEYGLFNKISRTVPTPRIQVLTIKEGPLHRWFGRQSVQLQTVGGSGIGEMDVQDSGAKVESQWLAPMIATQRVPELLRNVIAEVDLEAVQWQTLAQRAWWRMFKRWSLVVIAATVPLAVFLDPWALAVGLPLLALGYANARLYVKHAGYALTPSGVWFKSGWWNRTVKIVRYSKIQTVARRESPFDRRNGMASVVIDTAGAEMIAHTIDIPYLDSPVAATISRRLYDEASHREFRW